MRQHIFEVEGLGCRRTMTIASTAAAVRAFSMPVGTPLTEYHQLGDIAAEYTRVELAC